NSNFRLFPLQGCRQNIILKYLRDTELRTLATFVGMRLKSDKQIEFWKDVNILPTKSICEVGRVFCSICGKALHPPLVAILAVCVGIHAGNSCFVYPGF